MLVMLNIDYLLEGILNLEMNLWVWSGRGYLEEFRSGGRPQEASPKGRQHQPLGSWPAEKEKVS